MSISTPTIEQRVAEYAKDVIQDFKNFEAMKLLVETLGRSSTAPSALKGNPPHAPGAIGITQAVFTVVAASPTDIGRDAILRKLERENFALTATNPKKAVGDALQRLCRDGKLVRARKGKGGRTNLYRKAV